MDTDIEKATPDDFAEILELYHIATSVHKKLGIIQWDDEYPSGETLKENLESEVTWVIKVGDKIIATVTLDEDQDPQYKDIQWAYPSSNVLVVHRVCIDPSFQGRGLAKRLMLFSETFARENNYEVIRFDAFLGNNASQRLYRNMGYHEAIGYCYYHPDMIMCNCFEKRVY
ncbi:MAG: GNAT family N-acetyltransferase [Saprospiraceae bacterium]